MSNPPNQLGLFGYAWRVAAIALAYAAATMFSGAVLGAAKVPMPVLPQGAEQARPVVALLAGAFLLAACMAPLARGLAGTKAGRWLALAPFTYVCTGFNNAIEASFFTTLGGTPAMMLIFLAPCLLAAWLAVALIPAADTVAPVRPLHGWWWRALLVWLAFPAIYWLFGMLAYPWVRDLYERPDMGLRVPGGHGGRRGRAAAQRALPRGRGAGDRALVALAPLAHGHPRRRDVRHGRPLRPAADNLVAGRHARRALARDPRRLRRLRLGGGGAAGADRARGPGARLTAGCGAVESSTQ